MSGIVHAVEGLVKKHKEIVKISSKEADLLKSLRPFLSEEKHTHIDRFIELIHIRNTLKDKDKKIECTKTSEAASLFADSSIHADGIYDIDKSCLEERGISTPQPFLGIILILALLKFS